MLILNAAYTTNMSTFNGEVNTFFSTVSALNNLVTNQINGLTISSDCRVIADSFRFFYNMYCVNYVNRSIKIGNYAPIQWSAASYCSSSSSLQCSLARSSG